MLIGINDIEESLYHIKMKKKQMAMESSPERSSTAHPAIDRQCSTRTVTARLYQRRYQR